ncbi:MAG TPA: bifunctional 4-hydroxy-2-oxoglutarate aldolase/2-dehydro-3-deoxy-phosphogluconate aldolase [Roseimicrobium sp.]|nr:bifunctional 4-hydroxy-2-oxoglutarate aldolase/2-dehydro-3-deoxy-phosphogluconate aldolase [Roseimicrobium sp.]
MRSKAEIIHLLTHPGLIAVVRAEKQEQALPLSKALIEGGVIAVEITMSTPNAIEAIRETKRATGDSGLIGVGTVLDVKTCQAAIDAGAEFVVSPITRPELVAVAKAAGVPIMLGAYTPTEAQLAYEAGADFIKIFPADTLGPAYIKSLRAPLPHLKIVPTGGVDVTNVGEFFKAGCTAVGIGSSLVSKAILKDNNWPALTALAKQFVAAANAARG